MASSLNPHSIDPGWFRRWSLQTLDLWRRAPSMFVLMALIPMLMMTFFPSRMFILILLVIPYAALVFMVLRLLNEQSSVQGLGAMIWAHGKDVAALTRNAFFGIFLLSLFSLGFERVFSGSSHLLYNARFFASPNTFYALLMTRDFFGVGYWAQLVALPFLPPMVFLTLLVGHNFFSHYQMATTGFLKNWKIALFFTLFYFFTLGFFAVLIRVIRQWLPFEDALLLAFVLLNILLMVLSTFGYLWCREMFEGTKVNIARKVFVKQNVFAE